ncbi:hypothetical protein [Rickettsia endosymbiont of Halotydeus destructor]|uniref:hypothetical protein n=1 Tax=Rickettsia endosymbiont of Halotydeus destructor TaxID=2996754 RepID=UPI003BB21AB9
MLKKCIILFLGLFILTGCTDNFRSYFKKSANDKLVDSKGFKGGKRKPLYNSKYITLAKKNIVEDNLDDDQEDEDNDNPLNNETINPTKRNRDMYLNMIKRDMARQKAESRDIDDDYPLNTGNRKVRKNNNDKEEKLEQELAQIKAMLRETRQDLSKYSCPAAQERNYAPAVYPSSPLNNKKSQVKKKFIREDDDNIGAKDNACAI